MVYFACYHFVPFLDVRDMYALVCLMCQRRYSALPTCVLLAHPLVAQAGILHPDGCSRTRYDHEKKSFGEMGGTRRRR